MTDGGRVPGNPDGMAAFPGSDPNTVILVRNHEIGPLDPQVPAVAGDAVEKYDVLGTGGTTTIVLGADRSVQQEFASLAGTCRNCAGGATPWGSWLSCEEIVLTPADNLLAQVELVRQPHGYVFEVPATATPAKPVPLVAMGRFNHEAAAVDLATSKVYQTEDREDGCFYRFTPQEPGRLAAGGKLEALKIRNDPQVNTSDRFEVGQILEVEWVAIADPNPPTDTVRQQAQSQGAAIFRRGEGCFYGDGFIYFTCTSGGRAGVGQVWRYSPKQETLELFVESPDRGVLDYPDNLTLTPFGDLLICEDGLAPQFLVGVTPAGAIYPFAHNALNDSEFAGICFAPDGQTVFVNIQRPGITLAIWSDGTGWAK
jgi:secreted PhoX family phosphatase